jgi:hypothetical protein
MIKAKMIEYPKEAQASIKDLLAHYMYVTGCTRGGLAEILGVGIHKINNIMKPPKHPSPNEYVISLETAKALHEKLKIDGNLVLKLCTKHSK